MRSTIAVSVFALSASVLAAPTPQVAAVSGLVGGLTSTVGSVTNPSAGSDNLISGNGNNNGQNNGNGNSAGNANGNNNQAGTGNAAGNGNTFNLKPLGGILGNTKRGLVGTVEGVQVAGPIVKGALDGQDGLLNGITVGPTTDSLTKGLLSRGLTDSLDLSKLSQTQLLSLLGQVTGALQTGDATSGVTDTVKPVTGGLLKREGTLLPGVTGTLNGVMSTVGTTVNSVKGNTGSTTDTVKPVTGAAGDLVGVDGVMKRAGTLLPGVTGTLNGVMGTALSSLFYWHPYGVWARTVNSAKGDTDSTTDTVKPVTGAVGGLVGTNNVLRREVLGGVTGAVNGLVGSVSTTAGSVTGATAGSGNSLLNNGNGNGQGNGNNNQAGNGNGNGNSAGSGNSAGNNNDFNVSPETELPNINGPLVKLPDVNVAPVVKSV
ncbi:unnamed protein product [Alternaria alternata]